MEQLLRELSEALRAQADRALLELPLDDLCRRVADADARELLLGLHEAGTGAHLRELLEDDRLVRYASDSCTAREAEALVRQLRRWLGDAAGPDDPARLVELAPAPHDAEGLLAWAEAHGVARVLYVPVERLLRAAGAGPDVLLIDACLGRAARLARDHSLLGDRLEDEARAYLLGEARAIAARAARAALHAQPLPAGPLGLLARRLRARCAALAPDALQALRFVPARPVTLDAASGVGRGALVTEPTEPPIAVAIWLSGYEHRALEGHCSACDGAPCEHVAALGARLFEACVDPRDRLHEALVRFVGVPSWQRFMHALTPDLARTPEGPAARDRLAFSLRLVEGALSVGVLLQRARAGGAVSPGKLVSPARQARATGTSDRDQVVLAALAAQARTLGPQHVPADLTVLRALVEHPNVLLELADDTRREPSRVPVQIAEERLAVNLEERPEGLLPRVTLAGHVIARAAARPRGYVLHHEPARARLAFAALSPPLTRLLDALAHFRGVLPPESYPQLASWLETVRRVAEVDRPKLLEGLARPAPDRLLLRITPRYDEGVDLSLSVRALPLAALWPPGQGPELVHGLVDGKPSSVRRELAREQELAQSVHGALALQDFAEIGPFCHRVDTNQEALALLTRAARLTHLLELEWAERARSLRVTDTIRTGDLKVGLFKRGDFCALSGGVQHGEALIAIDRLLDAARTGERFVPIGGGDYLEIEAALFDRLHAAQLCTLPLARMRQLPTAAAPHWLAQLGAETDGDDDATRAWLERARSAAAEDAPPAAPLEPTFAALLRPYQQRGLSFLLAVSRWAPGVCLADEMGLGKTVQAIGLLAARGPRGPQLVIAPTSVVDNWLDELARFAPQLRPIVYRGTERADALAALGAGGVLVTSFELVLRDRARFDPLSFATLVVDEAQVLRNARTLRARAIASLSAEFRLALSGTPIENRLGDLWSLFQLIAPGLLGSWARFRARFAVPIERYENAERAEALRALVAPLMLRREKRDVLKELPPRTEVVRLIELSQAEQDLYAAALVHARRALGKRRRDDAGRAVQILAELTRLRQLACHPRLVLGDSRVSSSKLGLLLELLEELVPRGHRVLIFSQFTSHLALIREAIEARGLGHVTLDGSTPAAERRKTVARFQRGEVPLFLISLKAGGTGLNLTAADYVVHMDPWWNPSSEDQASDRAHRIGQERPVTIVKLVAQDTIEARVLALHEHKRRLAASVLSAAEPDGQPALADLEALLDG